MPQAGHVSGPFPFRDRITISADAGPVLAGWQREPDLVYPVRQRMLHPQPSIGEHLHHERVITQRLRDERAHPAAAGQRDQVLEQQCADPPVVHVIGDRHGNLR